jgi:predicted MPP superfamily phosphohydrolase
MSLSVTGVDVFLCDVAPHVLLAPAAWFVASPEPRRRRLALALWVVLAVAAPFIAGAVTGDVFAVMRAASHVVFLELPIALGADALAARRSGSRRLWLCVAGIVVIAAVGVDAFLVEPRALEVRYHTLTSARVSERIRIAVVADLQLDHFGDHEREALDRVAAERPDVVLFAGDYIQHSARAAPPFQEEMRVYLERLSRLGIYAVPGNVDPPGWERAFPAAVTTFTAAPVATVSRDPISVTGLSLDAGFDTRIAVARAPGFHIVLGHAPDFSLGSIDADLLVAGHTHGGQVQLPWVGPLVTFSAVPRERAAGGLFEHGAGHLVVSRGIGMERGRAPRLRFRCKPELVILDIEPM